MTATEKLLTHIGTIAAELSETFQNTLEIFIDTQQPEAQLQLRLDLVLDLRASLEHLSSAAKALEKIISEKEEKNGEDETAESDDTGAIFF